MNEDISIYTGKKNEFRTLDYVLFSLMFVASAVIGFYHAYRDRKKRDMDDFHLGGRKMHPIPVSLSLAATFLSALTLLGTPSEIYTNGTMFYWTVFGMLIATAGAAHVFVPLFYRLNYTSCFQYFEARFGVTVRLIASVLFLLQTLVYMGFVLYAPSLAFEAVTGVSLWGCLIGTAAVCTLYTTLGGMKTVLWTDALQFTIMVAGLLAVLIEGSKSVGGFSEAWRIASENGRIEFLNFSPDPRTRHSVWTVAIGSSFFWLYLYGVNQAQVQRACSLPTLRRAQVALWMNYPGLLLIVTLASMIGVVVYALYHPCNPVKAKLIDRNDQLLPLFVLDSLGKVPGLAGVFIACVFSGGLSTISSGLTAMSAVILEDYIKPIAKRTCADTITKHGMAISKIIVVVTGAVQFGVAVLISKFSGLILQFSYSMYAITAGPIFGLYISGMLFPWTNQIGAIAGFLLSVAFMCWLGLGSLIEKPSSLNPPLPTYTFGCFKNLNASLTTNTTASMMTSSMAMTSSMMSSTSAAVAEEPLLFDFYRISYQWYTGLGMIVCVFIAVCVSFLTCHTDPKTIDSRLIIPIFDVLFPWLPEKIRKPLRFGVIYEQRDEPNGKYKVPLEDVNGQVNAQEKGHDNSSFVTEEKLSTKL